MRDRETSEPPNNNNNTNQWPCFKWMSSVKLCETIDRLRWSKCIVPFDRSITKIITSTELVLNNIYYLWTKFSPLLYIPVAALAPKTVHRWKQMLTIIWYIFFHRHQFERSWIFDTILYRIPFGGSGFCLTFAEMFFPRFLFALDSLSTSSSFFFFICLLISL